MDIRIYFAEAFGTSDDAEIARDCESSYISFERGRKGKDKFVEFDKR